MMQEWNIGILEKNSYELEDRGKKVPQCCCNAVLRFENITLEINEKSRKLKGADLFWAEQGLLEEGNDGIVEEWNDGRMEENSCGLQVPRSRLKRIGK